MGALGNEHEIQRTQEGPRKSYWSRDKGHTAVGFLSHGADSYAL